MEIGIPNIDILGIFVGIFNFLKTNTIIIFDKLLNIVGGNPIVLGLCIGGPIYIIIDLIYHNILDKPTASLGVRMMGFASSILIFIIVFVFSVVMWRG